MQANFHRFLGSGLSRCHLYIIRDGPSPYFTRLNPHDLKFGLPFSVYFDETSTTHVEKQMDLSLRYWSPWYNVVCTFFYTSLLFGHAESDKVAGKMYNKILCDGIPVDKIATLIQDGPNVNKTIF